ncbi:MAG: hypothetical protein DI535_16455 [Citrobacter freundii]|nr:MAG: hypothetical protein DI535_16455 [Citrobacter freundii]
MVAGFSYSILRYHHSILLGEVINVGILFLFPSVRRLEFVADTGTRVQAIYHDFDSTVYNYIINNIRNNVEKNQLTFFEDINSKSALKKLIDAKILAEDATVLQFAEPVNVLACDSRCDDTTEKELARTVQEFSRLLLPGIS